MTDELDYDRRLVGRLRQLDDDERVALETTAGPWHAAQARATRPATACTSGTCRSRTATPGRSPTTAPSSPRQLAELAGGGWCYADRGDPGPVLDALAGAGRRAVSTRATVSARPTVSTVITTYDRPGGLRRALASVCAQPVDGHEVVAVLLSGVLDDVEVVAKLLIDADPDAGVLVVTRLPGEPVTRDRYPSTLHPHEVRVMLETARDLQGWSAPGRPVRHRVGLPAPLRPVPHPVRAARRR